MSKFLRSALLLLSLAFTSQNYIVSKKSVTTTNPRANNANNLSPDINSPFFVTGVIRSQSPSSPRPTSSIGSQRHAHYRCRGQGASFPETTPLAQPVQHS